MNTYRGKLLLILILIIPTIFLSGCEDVDMDLAEKIIKSWAEENELVVNGQWKPEGMVKKAVQNTVAEITNQEPFIQLGALDVIRDIEKADQLADEGMINLDTAKMSSAVSIRPHDWILQEKDAAVWLAHGNAAAAQTAFSRSDDILLEAVANGEECLVLRQHQLKIRRDTILDAIKICQKDPNCSDSEVAILWEEWQSVNNLRGEEFRSQNSDVCPDN